MSKKSQNLNRPFSGKLLTAAKKFVDKYKIILVKQEGEWYGRGMEMPNVFADGKTPDECIKNTREALIAAAAYLLEQGEAVPAPATAGRRTEQVNVRLSAEEKAILSVTARSHGFRGVGDFIRSRALASAM